MDAREFFVNDILMRKVGLKFGRWLDVFYMQLMPAQRR